MSIGLYDFDFFKYNQVMFNLEIMKLATYFKRKREITVLSPTFSPDKYSTFYLRKDFYDGDFPSQITRYNNLLCGGLAFTNNVYIPFVEEIERSKPDIFLYERYKDLFISNSKTHQVVYKSLINNNHLRLSLDGKNIWKDFEKQLIKNKSPIFFFHDPDISSIEGAPQILHDLLSSKSYYKDRESSLGVKFPIKVYSFEDFQTWSSFTPTAEFFSIKINNLLNDEEFCAIVDNIGKTNKKLIYTIADVSSSKNDFIINQLPKIFKQVIYLCMHHHKILLNIEDDFLIEPEWIELIGLINSYISAAESYTTLPAMYRFCKKLKEREDIYRPNLFSKEDARRLFLYVMDKQPELFKLFYECNQVKLINGGLECI